MFSSKIREHLLALAFLGSSFPSIRSIIWRNRAVVILRPLLPCPNNRFYSFQRLDQCWLFLSCLSVLDVLTCQSLWVSRGHEENMELNSVICECKCAPHSTHSLVSLSHGNILEFLRRLKKLKLKDTVQSHHFFTNHVLAMATKETKYHW